MLQLNGGFYMSWRTELSIYLLGSSSAARKWLRPMVFASGTGHHIRHDDLNSRCPTLAFAHETQQSLGINVQIFLLADDDGEGVHY